MKIGDIVRDGKKEGMIIYRKSNQNIGVNFGHYSLLKDKIPPSKIVKVLRACGCDKIYEKHQLKLMKP